MLKNLLGIITVLALVAVVMGIRAVTRDVRSDTFVDLYRVQQLQGKPIAEQSLDYQNGIADIENDSRAVGVVVMLVVTSIFMAALIAYMLVGKDGLNGLVRQVRLARRKRQDRPAPIPRTAPVSHLPPGIFPDMLGGPVTTVPRREASPWLLPESTSSSSD